MPVGRLKQAILDTIAKANPRELAPASMPAAIRVSMISAWPLLRDWILSALENVPGEALEAYLVSALQKAADVAGYRFVLEPIPTPAPAPAGSDPNGILDPRD